MWITVLCFGVVSQAAVRGTLQFLEPSQILLLGQRSLLAVQRTLQGQSLLLEGQLQTAFLLKVERCQRSVFTRAKYACKISRVRYL